MPSSNMINLSNDIDKLNHYKHHKNTNNVIADGIWFDRYIAFLTALHENQYFKDNKCTIEEFQKETTLDKLANFTYNKMLEFGFMIHDKPIMLLNCYLYALPGFSWKDYQPKSQSSSFNHVAEDQHHELIRFTLELLSNLSG